MRQNATPFYERGQSRDRASQAKSAKLSGTNAPGIRINDRLDQVVGLNDVKTAYVFLRMPDGQANLELIKFYTPSDEKDIQQPFANTLGIRHIAFVVEDIEAIVAKLKKKGQEIFSEIQYYEES
jgi:hypothetical protein